MCGVWCGLVWCGGAWGCAVVCWCTQDIKDNVVLSLQWITSLLHGTVIKVVQSIHCTVGFNLQEIGIGNTALSFG